MPEGKYWSVFSLDSLEVRKMIVLTSVVLLCPLTLAYLDLITGRFAVHRFEAMTSLAAKLFWSATRSNNRKIGNASLVNLELSLPADYFCIDLISCITLFHVCK